MSRTKRRAASLAVAATVAGGLAVAGTGSAAAVPSGQYCYFHRGSDQVVSAGPFHAGIANGDCSFVTFGNGFPGEGGHTGVIGIGNIQLPNGQWAVAEVDDVFGVAPVLADPGNNMPF